MVGAMGAKLLATLVLSCAAALGAAAQPGAPGGMGQGMMTGSMARFHQAMMGGVPEPYRRLRDPLPDTPQVLRRGAEVYAQNCLACHGPRGRGDGPQGQELDPRPANLGWVAHAPMGRSDPFMYWTVAEGGRAFGTAMPSFRRTLPSKAIWEVIHYLRHGLPAAGQ